MKRNLLVVVTFTVLLGLGACGGSSGGGLSVASLEGTWFGAGRDLFISGAYGTLTVTMDGEGGLSGSETVNFTSFSGDYALETGQIFGFELTDGTEGGLIVNSAATHALFVSEDGAFGIVEKDTSSLPTYVNTDIVGSWSGIGAATDGLDFTQWTSEATVDSDFSFSGSDSLGDSFTGDISFFSIFFGYYLFTSFSDNEGSGFGEVFVSPDKTFAGSWGCTGSCVFPDDVSFTAWDKQ